jgi:hypothetical protein
VNACGCGKLSAKLMADVVLAGPAPAGDDDDAAPTKGAKKARIIPVDVDRLPPVPVKQLLLALAQADSALVLANCQHHACW